MFNLLWPKILMCMHGNPRSGLESMNAQTGPSILSIFPWFPLRSIFFICNEAQIICVYLSVI